MSGSFFVPRDLDAPVAGRRRGRLRGSRPRSLPAALPAAAAPPGLRRNGLRAMPLRSSKFSRPGRRWPPPTLDQIGSQRGQSFRLIVRPPEFDRHVAALDITGIVQALAEGIHHACVRAG